MKKLYKKIFFLILNFGLITLSQAQTVVDGDIFTRRFRITVDGKEKRKGDTIFFEKADQPINVTIESQTTQTIHFKVKPITSIDITAGQSFVMENLNSDTILASFDSKTFTVKSGSGFGVASLNFADCDAKNKSDYDGIVLNYDGIKRSSGSSSGNSGGASPKCHKLSSISNASIFNCSGAPVNVEYQITGGKGYFLPSNGSISIPPGANSTLYTYHHALGYKDSAEITYKVTGDSIESLQQTATIYGEPVLTGSYCASSNSISLETTGDSTTKALLITNGTNKPNLNLLKGKDASSLISNTLLSGSAYYFDMGKSEQFTISKLGNAELLLNKTYSIIAVHYSGNLFALDTSFSINVNTDSKGFPINAPGKGITNAKPEDISNTSALISFNSGDGNARLVLIQKDSYASIPSSGPNAYSYSGGSYITSSGKVTLKSLMPSTKYYVKIVELNLNKDYCQEYYNYNTSNVGSFSFTTQAAENLDDIVNDLTVSNTQPTVSGTYNNITVANGGHAILSDDIISTGVLTVQKGGVLDLNGHNITASTIIIEDDGIVLETNRSDATGFGNASVQVKRSASTSQYDYLSTPVNGGRLSGEICYTYDESGRKAGNFVTGWDTLNTGMVPGMGYASFKPGNTSDFSGILNNGTISVPVTYTFTDKNVAMDGWNLLGNPYASPVDINKFLSANSSAVLSSGVYFWNGSNYSTLNSGNIPVAQGFFVHAQNSGGIVTFNNAMRTTGANALYRLSQTTQKINLSLSSNLNHDNLQIELRDDASDSFEPAQDAMKLKVPAANEIYALTYPDKKPVAINILSDEGNEKLIPLGLNIAQGGTFNLSLDANSLTRYPVIMLKDLATGSLVDLTKSAYTFTAAQSSDLRLELVLSDNEVTGSVIPGVNKVLVSSAPGSILINSQGKETQIRVTDIMGKIYYQGVNNGYSVSLPVEGNNLYLVQTQTAEGISIQKVIVY